MDAHGAGADGVPIASDVLRYEIVQLTSPAGNSWDLALAPFRQSGCRSDLAGVLDRRAQYLQVSGGGEVARIDEKWRVRIGRGDPDAPTALRPDEGDAYRKTLVGLDLGSSHRSGGEQSVRIGTGGIPRAPKEETFESRRHGVRLGQRLDVHGAIHAAGGACGLARTRLDLWKARPEPGIVPAVAARMGPVIEIGGMAPNPYHRVDAAGPPEDPSPRPVDDAPRRSCLRDRAIGPVDVR